VKNLTATICLTITLLLGSVGASWSADYKKGVTAYRSGDFATALREWKPLAKQGDASAQRNLGLMYRKGNGVPQDYKTALKWYRLAAKQGSAAAQYNLGQMYRRGQGAPKDDKTAAKWYTLAAKQGHASAQSSLGLMYRKGKGVLKDYVYAHMWGNIAATNGNKLGAKLRDDFEKKMTPSQLETAQKLARECVRKKYKGC
jgi:TPR repeat protein